MICPDLILHNYYSKDSDSSLFSTPVVPCPQWDCLPTEQIRYAWGSCVTRQNLGLCDMNCYSVNGSPASQGGIPRGGISQIKTEQFLFIVESASPSMSLLSLHSFVPISHRCWATGVSPFRKGGHRPEGICLLPPQAWEAGLL